MRAAVEFCVADRIADCVRLAIPQLAERQHVGNQIDAASIFTRSNFVAASAAPAQLATSFLISRSARPLNCKYFLGLWTGGRESQEI